MKPFPRSLRRRFAVVTGAAMLLLSASQAFPPAPNHVIYGLVRNEFGDPLSLPSAQIILETITGVQITDNINPNREPGVNYRLSLAMDAGTTLDLYKPTALKPTIEFRIKVKIGTTTYLPIEMTANYANLGKPAQSTRIDLTIGEDSDGDGLPDAWERLLLAMLGGGTLADIRPGDDADGDGISNLNEYLAGTYAFDPADGFRLNLVPRADGPPLLEFMVVNGRTYTIHSSTNLQDWMPLPIKMAAEGAAGPSLPNYHATDVRTLQVEPIIPSELPSSRYFFKVQVQ